MQPCGKVSPWPDTSLIDVFSVKARLPPPVMSSRTLIGQMSPVKYRERCKMRRTEILELIYINRKHLFQSLRRLKQFPELRFWWVVIATLKRPFITALTAYNSKTTRWKFFILSSSEEEVRRNIWHVFARKLFAFASNTMCTYECFNSLAGSYLLSAAEPWLCLSHYHPHRSLPLTLEIYRILNCLAMRSRNVSWALYSLV